MNKKEFIKLMKWVVSAIFIGAEMGFKLIMIILLIHYWVVICHDEPNVVFIANVIAVMGVLYIIKSFSGWWWSKEK